MNIPERKELTRLAQQLSNASMASINGAINDFCDCRGIRTTLWLAIIANMAATASVNSTVLNATPEDILRIIIKSAEDQLNQRGTKCQKN